MTEKHEPSLRGVKGTTANDGQLLDIAAVVEATGLPPSTLHLWERRGLITPVARRGLRRQYAPDTLNRVAIVVVSQRAGFTLGEIAKLFAPDAFASGKDRLIAKLGELEERRRQIDLAIKGLQHALNCPEPNPLTCERFLAKLPDVLPVEDRP